MCVTHHRFLIAAPHSGSGKTTVTAAILAGLRARGLTPQPFKAGPDYLDPTHLTRAAGRPARNLDSFLLPEARLRALFARAGEGAQVSVIEGVMGLYDGRDPTSDLHSSAHLARLLDCPVVLVIDASGMARTVAALAAGLRDFGRDLTVAGVILNRVGGARHAELCEAALAQVNMPCFGFLARDEALGVPGRHLGLLAAEQHAADAGALRAAGEHLRLDALLVATRRPRLSSPPPPTRAPARVRVAVARDEAFSFYYQDALDALEEGGAQLVPFSPLRDAVVPGAQGLLIGGGYPEAHAADLTRNASMRASVRAFARSGRPVLAECGGLMYLSDQLTDLRGRAHAMCGVVPVGTRMTERLTLGYREALTLHDGPLGAAGTALRAHEFHYSVAADAWPRPAFQVGEARVGHADGNVLASYLHLHLATDPALVERFLGACAAFKP